MASKQALMEKAYEVASRYDGNLTVRQLYYRLVAEGVIGSSQKQYRRIVRGLSDWRMAGLFPFDWLIDRTRENRPGRFTTDRCSVEDALEDAADEIGNFPYSLIGKARWLNQPKHVSVWVEKEALAGVLEGPCNTLGVSWLVLRGYASISTLYQWVMHTANAVECGGAPTDEIVILYFGDHDPDGFEIPLSALRNIRDIIALEGVEMPEISLKRVALNMDQIRKMNPPPFPAKRSSSRFAKYHRRTGEDRAWELDAIKPEDLDALIRDSVNAEFDGSIHAENSFLVRAARDRFRNEIKNTDWLEDVLKGD